MTEIYQEFNLVLKVKAADTKPETIRHLLDQAVQKALQTAYKDSSGQVETVEVIPR